MKPKPEGPKFEKEADLCAAFIAAVDAKKWVCYGETAGCDILAVRKGDGVQVGIEAKLRLNPQVVAQALPTKIHGDVGPDYRAVLVPGGRVQQHMGAICAALGITVIVYWGKESDSRRYGAPFSPPLPDEGINPEYFWHQWAPLRRHALPDYIPDVAAGSSSPIALTHWKIRAIKLAVILEERPLTRADFKAAGVSIYRWIDKHTGWLLLGDGGYVRGPYMPDFAAQHPKNYEEIKADKAAWLWASPRGRLL